MVVVGDVPSPWGEAAKGFLHIKGIEWAAVRLVYDSEPLRDWAGPSLLPTDAAERALVFGLAHEICGEAGLGWSRRLQLVHAGLQNAGGFPARVARYLSKKYGYSPEAGAASGPRVTELLSMLGTRLKAQREAGSRYYVGDALTAVDVYSATFTAMFNPLPPEHCQMEASMREAFETRDAQIEAALDPILLEHRDMMYAEYLELPLSL